MGLLDRAKDIFANFKSRDPLPDSTVTHDRIDEGVFEDFRERATTFDAIIRNAPTVPQGEVPDKCYSCGSDEPQYRIEQGQAICSQCNTAAQMPEAPYSGWADLVRDTFYANYTYDEPRVRREGEVADSAELNRRMMQQYINSDDLLETRPLTRLNEFESGFTAASFANGMHGSLKEGALAIHAKRSEDMRQYERDLNDIDQRLKDLQEQMQNNPDDVDDQFVKKIEDLIDQHGASSDALAGLQQQQQQTPIGVDVADAIDDAAKQARDDAEGIASMPGAGQGQGQRIAPDAMFALAKKWRENPILQRVAEIMGRLERDMRYKRANRVVGGFEEVVDVEFGDNAALALPHELSKLHHPLMRKDFFRRYHEQAIAQYELRGNEPEGKGPVVILRDESYSMMGDRNAWAAAVSLALVNIAHKEKRDACIIAFSSANEHKAWFFPGRQALDLEAIIDCASHFHAGGTDVTSAALAGEQVMLQVPEFAKADMVVITDGESYYAENAEELKRRLQSRGVRIHGVGVGGVYGYLSKFCESNIHVSDMALDGANEATDHLATAIT